MNYRNPWATCWASYREELLGKLSGFQVHSGTVEDIEIAVEFLQRAIVSSYENYCPLKITQSKDEVPW